MKIILFFCLTLFVGICPARAIFILTAEQTPAGVTMTGKGTIDRTGLAYGYSSSAYGSIAAGDGQIYVGSQFSNNVDYFGGASGPAAFGPPPANPGADNRIFADHSTGSIVGLRILSTGYIALPAAFPDRPLIYQLSGASYYYGATFDSLGFTPGTYTYTWGSGAHADSFVITSNVPEAGSTLALLGLVMVGIVAVRSKSSGSAV